jgi:hypothetical protein
MSTDRETTRIVRSWLEDGVTRLPDNVLDAVLDELPSTHQRRVTWWPTWRPFEMNNTAKLALTAAAVLVVAFLGIRYLLPADVGGPAETPIPTATPSPQSLTYSSTLQDIEPGTYSIPPGRWTPATLTFTMPAGWDMQYLGFAKNRDEPGEVGWATYIVTHVYTDTCAAEGEFELAPIGPTVDDLVNALQALGGAEVSPPVPTTIDGYPAQRVDVAMSEDIDLADCRVPALQIWANAAETDFYSRIPGAIDSIYVVDVEGETLAITASRMTASSASDVDELNRIIESIQIEPAP